MTSIPVGLTRDLPPKRVMRTQVDGQDLVVWRASNGDIAAWDNRCPHRGMALSHGFVRGNALACLYHGWHYGSSGACRYIPAHPDLTPPETIKTRTFSVTEQDGVIWVNIIGLAGPSALPFPTQPLRSFIVPVPPAPFFRACQSVSFQGAPAQSLGAAAYQLSARRIVLLQNPLSEDRTHITALADSDATRRDCAALSRWCEAARRDASSIGSEAA